jgi:catechol 2,3-dioxygenase-like lactoylglutathione lyase family enzyme
MSALGSYLRGISLLAVGIVIGTVMMRSTNAQENIKTGLRLNHVGIAVKDYQGTVDFYTKVMGFRKAFGGPTPDGKPGTIYLQISRETFLEIAPASEQLPEGITHIGIQADDADATVKRLRQNGATVTDARVVSVLSKSKLANVTDPNHIRLELNEAIPESLTRQAMDSWKE